MLILFFIIIFFAELIVASWLISKIRKADERILGYNKIITEVQPQLKDSLQKTKEVITVIHKKLNCFTASVADRKESCKNLFKNKYLTEIVMWLMKIPYKKIITVIDIVLTIRKIVKV